MKVFASRVDFGTVLGLKTTNNSTESKGIMQSVNVTGFLYPLYFSIYQLFVDVASYCNVPRTQSPTGAYIESLSNSVFLKIFNKIHMAVSCHL